MDPTASTMPMGRAAALPLSAADVMGSIPLPARLPAPGGPPPTAAGMINQGAPMGQAAQPAATGATGASETDHPFELQMQADGSGIYVSKTDPPIVLGVVPPPKIPKSLQPGTPPAK